MNDPETSDSIDDSQEVVDMLRDSADDFCARALGCERLRELRGKEPPFDKVAWLQMAELGWFSILVPESDGGLGLDLAAMSAVCRKLGGVAAVEPLIETAVGAIALLNSVDDAKDLVGSIINGEIIATVALGEVESDPFTDLQAISDGDNIQVSGVLSNVPVGPDADVWIVPAILDGEAAWLTVDAHSAAANITPLELSDGGRDARVVYDACPASILSKGGLARDGLAIARNYTAVASSSYLLGLSESLLDQTKEYVGTRWQFGQSIGSFQTLQHRIVDLYLAIRLCNAVLDDSLDVVAGRNQGDAEYASSRARYRTCETTRLVIAEAVQIHGAIGYTDECDVGLYLNRALVVIARYGQPGLHLKTLSRLRPRRPPVTKSNPQDFHLAGDAKPPNGDWNELGNDDFRGVIRQWLEANYPSELRNSRRRPRWAECRDWYEKLYQRGWAAPGWPREHGGMGLRPDKFLIFVEERERWGVARTPDQGIIMVGPLLMQHGSPEQQAYYLPSALSGEHIWCQGYSEPNAGSDLASLMTSAVRDGDEFVINGQKTWTTMAQDASHMFCLVRTDAEAKPQAGISFVLIDFSVPGITVRPIKNISGDAEFCEVFFDDVRVPVANLVGDINDGWRIAKALLGFERLFIGNPKQCQLGLSRLQEIADARGLHDDPVFVDRAMRFEADVADLESLYKEFADIVRRDEPLGPDVSLLKIWSSETVQRLSEFILESAGASGACVDLVDFGTFEVDIMSHYYNARPTAIYGGSNEIQRNIIAKNVLSLPSS